MTTYDKVKAFAEKQQKSIASIEIAAGVANGTISGWKTGRPYAETLQKIAIVLGCQMEELLPDLEG